MFEKSGQILSEIEEWLQSLGENVNVCKLLTLELKKYFSCKER